LGAGLGERVVLSGRLAGRCLLRVRAIGLSRVLRHDPVRRMGDVGSRPGRGAVAGRRRTRLGFLTVHTHLPGLRVHLPAVIDHRRLIPGLGTLVLCRHLLSSSSTTSASTTSSSADPEAPSAEASAPAAPAAPAAPSPCWAYSASPIFWLRVVRSACADFTA